MSDQNPPAWALEAAKAVCASDFDPDFDNIEVLARIIAAAAPKDDDSRRLDWLEVERPELVAVCDEKDTWHEVREVLELTKLGKGTTLRAAIDAAMKGDA